MCRAAVTAKKRAHFLYQLEIYRYGSTEQSILLQTSHTVYAYAERTFHWCPLLHKHHEASNSGEKDTCQTMQVQYRGGETVWGNYGDGDGKWAYQAWEGVKLAVTGHIFTEEARKVG